MMEAIADFRQAHRDVRLYPLQGLAAVTGVSEAVLRREDKEGHLPYHVFGKRRLYNPDEVLEATIVPCGLVRPAAAVAASVRRGTPGAGRGMTEADIDRLAKYYPKEMEELRAKRRAERERERAARGAAAEGGAEASGDAETAGAEASGNAGEVCVAARRPVTDFGAIPDGGALERGAK